jgi:hypothetical protein
MIKIRVREEIDLDKLLDYGFKKSEYYEIYSYILQECTDIFRCSILVNTTEHYDRVLRFYYYDLLEGQKIGEPLEYDIPIPGVIFKLIQDNVVEIC